jgi:hypothetical protein
VESGSWFLKNNREWKGDVAIIIIRGSLRFFIPFLVQSGSWYLKNSNANLAWKRDVAIIVFAHAQ